MVYILLVIVALIATPALGWVWWRNSLERKSPDALFALARKALDSGNRDLAAQAFRRAAERGHVHAQFNVGTMYLDGLYFEKNRAQAAEWFTKAASQGMPQAQHNLGVMFLNGMGVPVDRDHARKWFEAAAAQGMKEAKDMLATMDNSASCADFDISASAPIPVLPDALKMDHRMERHLKVFQRLDDPKGSEEMVFERVCNQVEKGDPDTQALAGVLTFNRSKSDNDRHQARALLERATSSDHAHAKHLVTSVWPKRGEQPNGAGAILEAARRGEMHAQYELGGRYRRGEGFEQSIPLATQWYQKAAAQGHPEAEFCMALAYLHGWGIERDPPKAVAGLRDCAKRGDRDAASWLFNLFTTGDVNVSEDRDEAAYWLRRAADLGDSMSQYEYGLSLPSGNDEVHPEAMAWFEKAAAQGNASAIQLIEELKAETSATASRIDALPDGD